MNSGIYKILNKINGKFYIGSAKSFTNRWQAHRWHLNNNKHYNSALQRSWNKYWSCSFEFIILEYCEAHCLREREQHWIDISDCIVPKGYNMAPIVDRQLGVKRTQETKDKISAANKGHKAGMTGLCHSDETRMLMSIIQKGITNRNFEKWPCEDGYYCKCDKCKNKRNDQIRLKRYERMFGITHAHTK